MIIFEKVSPNLLESSSIALGVFDGVHVGHAKVIKNAIKIAEKNKSQSCVVTFSNHPQEVLNKNHSPQIITTMEKKLDLFADLGVDNVLLIEFSRELMTLSAEQYLKSILVDSLNPIAVTTGFNHHFGANKKGDAEFLEKYSNEFGYNVSIVPPVVIEGQTVSSSLIRKCIFEGAMVSVSKYLGRDFSLKGKVVKGAGEGRKLGFPTANIGEFQIDIANGVYFGWVKCNNKKYKSAINIGSAPTIKNSEKVIEAHILGFSKDIYGEVIEVGLCEKLRDEKEFSSKEELVNQIQNDIVNINSK